jgi:hypothetical protein
MPVRLSPVSILVLLALALGGCRQRSVEKAPPPAAIPITSEFNVIFDGAIDTRLRFQMELERIGQELPGQYFYEKTREETGGRQYIVLKGQIRQDGSFALNEFDGTQETGRFEGTLQSETIGGESILRTSGTWLKAGASKALPFSAVQRRIDLGRRLKLKAVTYKEDDKKSKSSVDATFPNLEGDGRAEKFNQVVHDLVSAEIPGFKAAGNGKPPVQESAQEKNGVDTGPDAFSSSLDLGYEVTAANPDVISLLFGVGTFVEGAAHSQSNSLVLNYDLKAGKVLQLSDLFKADSDYLKVISDYCIRSLKKREVSDDRWRQNGAGPNPGNYKSWNLVRGGLLISFDAYQVASYADGPQEVFIPFGALKEILKPDGPVASLMQ